MQDVSIRRMHDVRRGEEGKGAAVGHFLNQVKECSKQTGVNPLCDWFSQITIESENRQPKKTKNGIMKTTEGI